MNRKQETGNRKQGKDLSSFLYSFFYSFLYSVFYTTHFYTLFFFLFPVSCFLFPIFLMGAEKPAFDRDRAFKYLIKQCEFGPRPVGSNSHKQIKSYLISELKRSAIKVSSQNFTVTDKSSKNSKNSKNSKSEPRQLQLTNVIAEFGPIFGGHSQETKEAKETLLLGAHWDTRPVSDQDFDPEKRSLPILGANDGASGVAVLLELAKLMAQKPPDIRVIIALFDGEDYGEDEKMMFLGSKYFAKNMGSWKPSYGIVIDMVGDRDLSLPMEQTSLLAAPNLVKELWKRAERLGLKAFEPKVRSAILDDHVPLINSGVACLDIIDLDYPYWHTSGDTVDKCSAESLETVGKLLVDFIYER